jgi:hypothetical protein
MLDIIFSDDSGERALRKCDSSDVGMAVLGMTESWPAHKPSSGFYTNDVMQAAVCVEHCETGRSLIIRRSLTIVRDRGYGRCAASAEL